VNQKKLKRLFSWDNDFKFLSKCPKTIARKMLFSCGHLRNVRSLKQCGKNKLPAESRIVYTVIHLKGIRMSSCSNSAKATRYRHLHSFSWSDLWLIERMLGYPQLMWKLNIKNTMKINNLHLFFSNLNGLYLILLVFSSAQEYCKKASYSGY
jgi:hypothetical protein